MPGGSARSRVRPLTSRKACCARSRGSTPSAVTRFGHGTTTGTNALLQRRGAVTALVTTAGFEHVLALARQRRHHLYRPCESGPAPLVPLDRCHGVDERITPTGVERGARARIRRARGARPAAAKRGGRRIAVAQLCRSPATSTRSPSACARCWRGRPPLGASIDLVPEIREYERASTVAADAYLGPIVSAYLRRLAAAARAHGLLEPAIVLRSGGVAPAAAVARHPAPALLSGPAAGAAGAALAGAAGRCPRRPDARHGRHQLRCCGGIGVEAGRTTEGRGDGRPVRLPMLDVQTVGAGGGSYRLARRGRRSARRPGAGAHPGPACYGGAANDPTVTDANALLGYLPTGRAGRRGHLDREAAARRSSRSATLGLDALDDRRGRAWRSLTPRWCARCGSSRSSAGSIRVRSRSWPSAVPGPCTRVPSPRSSASPACSCPRAGGVLTALGLACREVRLDYVRPLLGGDGRASALRRRWRSEASEDLDGPSCVGRGRPALPRAVVRADRRGRDLEGAVAERFAEAHERRYGYRMEGEGVELVNARVVATMPVERPRSRRRGRGRGRRGQAQGELRRRVERGAGAAARRDGGGSRRSKGRRSSSSPRRPASCGPGWSGAIDAAGTLVLERSDEPRSRHPVRPRQRALGHRRGDGRGADPRRLLLQHQGAPRLLDRAVRRRRGGWSRRPSTSPSTSARCRRRWPR